MIGLALVGILFIVWGLVAVIKGKIPFIKKYNVVKNVSLHSRIEGSAILLVGFLLVFQYFIPMKSVTIIVSFLGVGVLALVFEIVFKAI